MATQPEKRKSIKQTVSSFDQHVLEAPGSKRRRRTAASSGPDLRSLVEDGNTARVPAHSHARRQSQTAVAPPHVAVDDVPVGTANAPMPVGDREKRLCDDVVPSASFSVAPGLPPTSLPGWSDAPQAPEPTPQPLYPQRLSQDYEQAGTLPPADSHRAPVQALAGHSQPPHAAYQPPTSGTASQPIILDEAPRAGQSSSFGEPSPPMPAPGSPGCDVDPDAGYESVDEQTLENQVRELQRRLQRIKEKRRQREGPITAPQFDEPRSEPVLCNEQAELVNLIMSGKNVFYTGSAGCGKSTVLKAFVAKLRAQGKQVHIIAPTGRAALAVNGTTTWTFAGWTPDSNKFPLERIRKGAHGDKVYERMTKCNVLVIDEISMIEATHFERLNELLKAARNADTGPQPAFGGCQIVVTGDFCQLPPVKPFRHCYECGYELRQSHGADGKQIHTCRKCRRDYADEDKWAFRSQAWQECEFQHVHLKTIHRQNDEVFIRMLQKCRLGHRLTEQETALLLDHTPCEVSEATKLFCTNMQADRVNKMEFEKIAGPSVSYWAHDKFQQSEKHPHLYSKGQRGAWGHEMWTARPPQTKLPLKALDEDRWRKCVELKTGMLVVLLTNLDLDAGLCNGSQGIIEDFVDHDPKKMPTKQKYKSRGSSGQYEEIPLKDGQRPLRGEHALLMEAEIRHFIGSESAPVKKWPVVRFHNGCTRVIQADCSVNSLGDEEPYSLLCRTQVPLAPAWAMTIHKSQSLTLDRVIVNLDRSFAEGQIYVALSRATGLAGLKVEGSGDFLRNKPMVNAEVAEFLKQEFGDIYGGADGEAAG